MAGFKAHIAFGGIAGVILSTIIYIKQISNDFIILLFFVLCTLIGSFLPDLDSDSGIPFKIVFGIFALLSGAATFVFLYEDNSDLKIAIGISFVVILFVRFIVGNIFKKLTHHRGIFHSVPALLISFSLVLFLTNKFQMELIYKILIPFSVALGFLTHLLLDEFISFTNFSGRPFRPKKSLGSALEIISNSKFATLLAYSILAILVYLNYPIMMEFFRTLNILSN